MALDHPYPPEFWGPVLYEVRESPYRGVNPYMRQGWNFQIYHRFPDYWSNGDMREVVRHSTGYDYPTKISAEQAAREMIADWGTGTGT